jgi:hypothetical protein
MAWSIDGERPGREKDYRNRRGVSDQERDHRYLQMSFRPLGTMMPE